MPGGRRGEDFLCLNFVWEPPVPIFFPETLQIINSLLVFFVRVCDFHDAVLKAIHLTHRCCQCDA